MQNVKSVIKTYTVIILLFIFIAPAFFSQERGRKDEHIFALYAGPGVALPLGSFSERSNKYNDFKVRPGLDYRGGLEWYFNSKNCLSIDGDINLFTYCKNDSLWKQLDHRLSIVSNGSVSAQRKDIDISIFHYHFSYSHIFEMGPIFLMPKLGIGVTSFEYEFFDHYSHPTGYNYSNGTVNYLYNVEYTVKDKQVFSVKPEINIKYVKHYDGTPKWMLGLTWGYFYIQPKVPLYETNNGNINIIRNLNGPVSCVVINANFSLFISGQFVRNIRQNWLHF